MSTENPYYFNLPVEPTDFLGRWPIVDEIVADLTQSQADSWAIIGGRRFGKSSALKAIAWRLQQYQKGSLEAGRFILPVIVDLKGNEGVSERYAYARILKVIGRAIRDVKPDLDFSASELYATLAAKSEACSFDHFEDVLLDLAARFASRYGLFRLVIMLDETEAVLRSSWADNLLGQWRALIYSGPLADTLKMIFVGSVDLLRKRQTGSPLLNILKITFLDVLSQSDVRLLIDRGGVLDESAMAEIMSQSGGHPFIAQFLLHYLWPFESSLDIHARIEQVRRKMYSDRAADLSGWWNTVGDHCQKAYQVLLGANDWIDERTILRSMRAAQQPIDEDLDALVYHGLVIRDPTRQRYRIGSTLFREWILKNVEANPNWPPRPEPSQNTGDLNLRVELSADRRKLTYTLHSPQTGDYHFTPLGEVTLASDPRDILQRVFDRLSSLAHLTPDRRSPSDTCLALEEMADIGANLYTDLLPDKFKALYPRLRERYRNKTLLVTSDEPWIPWEIIRPVEYGSDGQAIYDDPCLCEMFQLARWRTGVAPPSELDFSSGMFVIPAGNLQAAQREVEFFTQLSSQQQNCHMTGPASTIQDVEGAFRSGQYHLYHFACHGNFDLSDPNESKLRLSGGFLRPSQIAGDKKGGLQKARPFIFVNACNAGQIGVGLTRLGGWADTFISAGASAFIGSLWEINDRSAATFAMLFYQNLLGLAGEHPVPLAEAVRLARLKLKEMDPANPTWLAYTLFGNPSARVLAAKRQSM